MPHACTGAAGRIGLRAAGNASRSTIRKARIVGNPGCYPTAIQLGFLPLVEAGVVDHAHLIADAKSGVSGAGPQGRAAALMFSEAADNFKAYNVGGHRHHPEIVQGLNGTQQGTRSRSSSRRT